MRRPNRNGTRGAILTASAVIALAAGLAEAQTNTPGSRGTSAGFVGSWPTETQSSAAGYLPTGAIGGFVPYNPGPARGGSPVPMSGGMPELGGFSMGSMSGRSVIGKPPGDIAPLRPITPMRPGVGIVGGRMPNLGMGMGTRSGVGRSLRSPVGAYPFRSPRRLGGSATTSPAMSM
jgi:hypothetical protein